MSWFRGPQAGDWIRVTRPIKARWTDHLLGHAGAIKPGTRGVITRSAGWNSFEARLDLGLFGSVTTRVKASQICVTRRGGGVEAHTERASRLRWFRAGVALALVGPPALFCFGYILHGGSKSGLVATLLEAAIAGTVELFSYLVSNPFHGILYLVILWAAGRFAFR